MVPPADGVHLRERDPHRVAGLGGSHPLHVRAEANSNFLLTPAKTGQIPNGMVRGTQLATLKGSPPPPPTPIHTHSLIPGNVTDVL